MVIYGVYIVSKSGGLIFNHDHNVPKIEIEKQFHYPLDIKLAYENKKIIVSFGQRDGINGTFYLTILIVKQFILFCCNSAKIFNFTLQHVKQSLNINICTF